MTVAKQPSARRPTKLTPKSIDTMERAISLGASYNLAAKAAGCSYDSFRRWVIQGHEDLETMRSVEAVPGTEGQGADGGPLYEVGPEPEEWDTLHAQLVQRIGIAEGEAAQRWLAQIEQAAQGKTVTDTDGNQVVLVPPCWQAAAWKLERRYPEAYGRRRVEHTGADGGPISLAMTDEVLDGDEEAKLLEQEAGGGSIGS